ncbi:MAG: trigger factor family protein, partial [Bacteroidota bacterium]
MNITKEKTGKLTATLKIEIGPSDYSAAVEKQIIDYKRKANIPGFRPGHIPTGLVKKMYGKAILADEVNKLLSDGLLNYIKEEKIDILGNPIPNQEKNSAVDFENHTDFEFYFDLGLSPEFTVPLNMDLHVEYPLIKVDDEMIDKYIEDTRKRFGKPAPDGTPEMDLPSEETSADVPAVSAKETVVEPAEMNPDFFRQVYPDLTIETEEDFRDQVRKDAESSFVAETDKLFFNKVTETLLQKTEIEMPDTFLKRWLLENNEGKYSPDEIEKN